MKTRSTLKLAAVLLFVLSLPMLTAQVKYDEGRMTINNVTLLQDYHDPSSYYYIPPYPRLAVNDEGLFEFVCLKFVDPDGDVDGGLIHFLVQYDLNEEEVMELQTELEKAKPGAKLMGAVPMFEPKDKEEDVASFKVISAVLGDEDDPDSLTKKLVTSGHAPLMPGSKTAVAAILKQEGASLLWETLDSPTSDLSMTINAEYEAVIEGFSGRISAEVSTVYEHMSAVFNKQEDYEKREVRQIVDKLMRDNVIEVDVFDRSEAYDIDSDNMQRIVDLCTDKLVNLIFDTETGLSKIPEKEVAVAKNQIAGRQDRGKFNKFFKGTGNPKYITDNSYVIKDRQDITQVKFMINLSGRTSVRIPFSTSGNIGGIYQQMGDDERLFKIVNLDDPSFQTREVHFAIDREYLSSFADTINFVSVSFRKDIPDRPETTGEIQITSDDVTNGVFRKSVSYPRLGMKDSEWLDYQYRVGWSVFGRETIYVPGKEEWIDSSDTIINLLPPFEKMGFELEVDRTEMQDNMIHSAVVEVRYKLMGKDKKKRVAILRGTDAESINNFTVYHDPKTVPEIRITWHGKTGLGKKIQDWAPADSSYLFYSPPFLEGSGE
jgi:hypothetical protein